MASKKPTGLGRGLGALLGDDVLKTESSGSLSLPISQVETCSSPGSSLTMRRWRSWRTPFGSTASFSP
jgi:hypothetical protein